MRLRVLAVAATAALQVGCGAGDNPNAGPAGPKGKAGSPSPDQVVLDSSTIPKFVNQLPILPVFAPTVIRNSSGQVIRNEYTITDSAVQVQMLPPGFPSTTVLAMGGPVVGGGTFQGSPAAVFENTRGIPTVVHWRTNIGQPSFMPVDPVLHWADPQAIEKPTAPFELFPPGYANAQFPVAHVTHTHGLMVLPHMDGTAEEWFTNVQYRGPSFVTEDYAMPNDQPATQLFYHDHVMGVTRLGLYAGEVGAAYMIRDPGTALDGPSSPLPKGPFEVVLAITPRQFFTDGELSFPPDRGGFTAGDDAPDSIPYWTYDDGSDTVVVNGKVWPNMNVQSRQYRFRMLMGGNTQLFDFQLSNEATGRVVPFTIIGSDGGYLPAPQTVTDVKLGITERADILVDFSQFAAGTRLIMTNLLVPDGRPPMRERDTPTSERAGASGAETISPPPGPRGRRVVMLGRLLLLAAAVVALVAALAMARQRDGSEAQARQGAVARYVCPMHPRVTSPVPGECPICHMELEKVAADAGPSPVTTRTSAVEVARRRTVAQTIRVPASAGEDRSVTAQLHPDDLVGVDAGEQALFFGETSPGVGIPVRLSPASPEPWGPSTVLLRFRPEEAAVAPGETGWVQLSPRPRKLLVVPVSAVLYSGKGAYVLAAPADGHAFTKREVRVGRILDSGYGAGLSEERTGGISVLSGLEEGERVVVGDTFFLDAERRLRAARGSEPEVTR